MPRPTGLFDGNLALLERALDLRSAQHRALSANIANADTPHYKAFEVAVEEALARNRAVAGRIEAVRTQERHLPAPADAAAARPPLRALAAPAFSLRADGNTVDLDRTMGALAENALAYKTSAQLVGAKLKSLRNVITGGR
ncbi:MAG: flagellar basal body rod protein FlgB [Desulfobacterales bacterium]